MENHLELHEHEHRQRVQHAERARLAAQLRSEQAKPNAALVKLGELLVEAGEQLKRQAQPQPRRRRV